MFPSSTYSNLDDFFYNSDEINCPLTTCTLSDAGSCGTGTFSGSSHISMLSSSPWTITAKRDVVAGYTYSVCLQCSVQNNEDTAKADNWDITLNGLDCSNTLSHSGSLFVTNNIAYVAGQNQDITPSDWNTYFSNTDSTNCPITECGIHAHDDCQDGASTKTSANSNVWMSTSSPWTLTMSKQEVNGYNDHFCIRCTNGGDTEDL